MPPASRSGTLWHLFARAATTKRPHLLRDAPAKGRIRGFCSDRRDPIIARVRVGAPMNALSRTIIHAFITS